ncbi:cytochrome c3 family protein [Novipirellula rosea]|uniref:Cytochrome c3 family protein n=1 Tax=Novipirellula rosea TaxID=1031540 RepID=A0ABP8NM07_9BACT
MGGAMLVIARSSYVTGQHIAVTQEVPFSHQHHVADIGIDCRYCHQNVETSPRAGLPTTQVCINCHRKLFNQTDLLAPVRASLREGKPLHWNRVHDLPDYVYFNHSIHVHKGIACYECHGNVGEMPLIMQAQPLTMQWCLDCHRDPQQHVRPRELVFEPQPLEKLVANPNVLRKELAEEYELTSRTDCYTCHR